MCCLKLFLGRTLRADIGSLYAVGNVNLACGLMY